MAGIDSSGKKELQEEQRNIVAVGDNARHLGPVPLDHSDKQR
jgi:hypothetical protein